MNTDCFLKDHMSDQTQDEWALGCRHYDEVFERLFANVERCLARFPGEIIDGIGCLSPCAPLR